MLTLQTSDVARTETTIQILPGEYIISIYKYDVKQNYIQRNIVELVLKWAKLRQKLF